VQRPNKRNQTKKISFPGFVARQQSIALFFFSFGHFFFIIYLFLVISSSLFIVSVKNPQL